ncbi:MAG: hypothetical protein IT464_13185 [Planctomycetes bacterium]|nr:hypothetical protein [Planctomycetota bacterium]
MLILVDPSAADAASLQWLGSMLSCAEAARDVATTTPMPALVVLSQTGTGTDPSDAFLDRLRALGARETRASGRDSDLSTTVIRAEIANIQSRHEQLLAGLALMPCPIELEDFEAMAGQTGSGAGALKAVTAGGLFRVVDGLVIPGNREVRNEIRSALGNDAIQRTAARLADTFEQRLEGQDDARVEILLQAGDARRASRLARKRFDDHYAAGNSEEALRILELATRQGMALESGRHASEVDQAKTAALNADAGHLEKARGMVAQLTKRRDLYRTPAFVEWLALAARSIALQTQQNGRMADSLMRRAIRLAGDDLDKSVRLTLLRVQLLQSPAFKLDERSTWLLSHVNNKMLEKVSQPTLAAFLEETANRRAAEGRFKGAFKRLRRLSGIETSDRRRAAAMLLMARCRSHFADTEGAARYASSALHYGIRAADLKVVKEAAQFLRETERGRPRAMPRIAPVKTRGDKPRLPAAADIATPQTPETGKLFEILQSRFGVRSWVRRRGSSVLNLGRGAPNPDVLSVYNESADGTVQVSARSTPAAGVVRGLVLLRSDGDDLVVFEAAPDIEPREDAIVRFLLADRAVTDPGDGITPSRKNVIDDYLRRALAHGTEAGLHATVEMLFNKDLLIYMEEQGLTKEEMADRLGVSRATLYRMFARAALN